MLNKILTYTKIRFNPLAPAMEDIQIEDIAHSLSLMTRANGHIPHFYSVAQHSLNCYKEAKIRGYSTRVQLGCLLHDASESYISDLTRPVKRQLPDYYIIEEQLQNLIYERFGLGDLTSEETRFIAAIDDTLLHHEFVALAEVHIFDPVPILFMEHDFALQDFGLVEQEFLAEFQGLISDRQVFNV